MAVHFDEEDQLPILGGPRRTTTTTRKTLRRALSSVGDGTKRHNSPSALPTVRAPTPPRKRGLRRTQSADPRMGTTTIRERTRTKTQSSARRIGTGNKYYYNGDHSGDRHSYQKSYSFWSSKPALAMFCFLVLSVQCGDGRFLYGAVLVFMLEVFKVLGSWRRFIVSHPIVQEFSEFTLEWFHYSLQQAERFCDRRDRTRKLAVGLFQAYYPVTSEYVADYIRERRAELTTRTLDEAARISQRLSHLQEQVQERTAHLQENLQEKGKRAAQLARGRSRRDLRE